MPITILGEHPLTAEGKVNPQCRIATVFVGADVLVTAKRSHFEQRPVYRDFRNQQLAAQGLPALSEEETFNEWLSAVDLICTDGYVNIRPDPENLPLAFEADRLLQEVVPKRLIKFLFVGNQRLRQRIRDRGEYWRISPVPVAVGAIIDNIRRSRIALGGRPSITTVKRPARVS